MVVIGLWDYHGNNKYWQEDSIAGHTITKMMMTVMVKRIQIQSLSLIAYGLRLVYKANGTVVYLNKFCSTGI